MYTAGRPFFYSGPKGQMSTILVIGLPRSGLTLTMQMLYAGGFPCVGEWPAFEPHPQDILWKGFQWKDCVGKAVKMVNAKELPPPGTYDVIRLRRDLVEQAMSIWKFGKVFGIVEAPIDKLFPALAQAYQAIDFWACHQQTMMTLDFETLINVPHEGAQMLSDFVGGLDVNKAASVVIDRSPKCGPELHELGMV